MTTRKSKSKGKARGKTSGKTRKPNTKGFVNEVNTVWGRPVPELARETGYTPSYLARCLNGRRRPSLEAVHGIHLATGKSYEAVLAEFWKDRPKTLKAHLALGEAGYGRGKHAGGTKTIKKAKAAKKGKPKAKSVRKAKPVQKKRPAKKPVKKARTPRPKKAVETTSPAAPETTAQE